MKRKVAFRKKRQNHLGMVLVSLVVMMLLGIVSYKNLELYEKQKVYAAKEEKLEEQIADENERTQEIEEFATYTMTKKFVEEIAREKLGLVYDNQIILKSDN